MPESFLDGSADVSGRLRHVLGPRDPIRMADEAWGIDMEGEVAVITGDVPMGVSAEEALTPSSW
jgi:fumarylacetoacetate (FAA) hydrolase